MMAEGFYFDGQSSMPLAVNFSVGGGRYFLTSTDGRVVEKQWSSPTLNSYKPGIFLEIQFESGCTAQFQRQACEKVYLQLENRQLGLEGKVNFWFKPSNIVVILCSLLGFIFIMYKLTTSEFMVDRLANLMSRETETELGGKIAEQYLEGFDQDKEKTALLSSYYEIMELPTAYETKVYFISDSTVNAFAMPGGYIFIHEGILDIMTHHAELSAVLAHESIHIESRHSLKALIRSGLSYGLISLVIGDVSGVAAIILENANSIRNLTYSRNYESESDISGMGLLCKSGIEPIGMGPLFEHLDKYEKEIVPDSKAAKLMNFLRSHPMTEERVSNAAAFMEDNHCDMDREKDYQLQELFSKLKK